MNRNRWVYKIFLCVPSNIGTFLGIPGRKQYVSVNGSNSDLLSVTCGVPQGSVLGPLLFLININDLPNASKRLTFYLFADDTNIYYEFKDLANLTKTFNKELQIGNSAKKGKIAIYRYSCGKRDW